MINCIFSLFIVSDLRSHFSLKKTGVQRKKYGLLSNYDDTMEMAHLESDEDDTTVYEAKSLRRYSNIDSVSAQLQPWLLEIYASDSIVSDLLFNSFSLLLLSTDE